MTVGLTGIKQQNEQAHGPRLRVRGKTEMEVNRVDQIKTRLVHSWNGKPIYRPSSMSNM